MLPVEADLANRIDVLGRKHLTRFRAVGYAPPISRPVYIVHHDDPWVLMPEEMANKKYPWGVNRSKRIFANHYPIEQWILADEAPKALPAPPPEPKPPRDYTHIKEKAIEIGYELGEVGRVVLPIAASAAIVTAKVAASVAASAVMVGLTLLPMALIDPILIAVVPTPQGTVWVEVARWLE